MKKHLFCSPSVRALLITLLYIFVCMFSSGTRKAFPRSGFANFPLESPKYMQNMSRLLLL